MRKASPLPKLQKKMTPNKWLFVDSGPILPRIRQTRQRTNSQPISPRPKSSFYFKNTDIGFTDEEVRMIKRTQEPNLTPQNLYLNDDTGKKINASRLDIAKELKLSTQKISDERAKQQTVKYVPIQDDEDEIISPRAFSLDEQKPKDSNVFISQSDIFIPPQQEEGDSKELFIPELKQHIMKFAEERHDKEIKLNEYNFTFGGHGSTATEHYTPGKRKLVNACNFYAHDDELPEIQNNAVMEGLGETFTIPRMENYLYTHNMQVPEIVTDLVFNKKRQPSPS